MPLERTVSLSGHQRPLSSVAVAVAVHQDTRHPAIGPRKIRLPSSLAAPHTRTASPCRRPAAAERYLDGEANARSNSPWTSHVGAQQSSLASLQISRALARAASWRSASPPPSSPPPRRPRPPAARRSQPRPPPLSPPHAPRARGCAYAPASPSSRTRRFAFYSRARATVHHRVCRPTFSLTSDRIELL